MELSNAKNFLKLKKNNVLFNILFLALIVSPAFIDYVSEYKITLIIITSILYISLLAYFILLKFTYIYFKDTGTKLLFRYYTLSPIGRKYLSFSIHKKSTIEIKIKHHFLKKREDLIISTKKNKKNASYPPISLSALKKEDKDKLLKYLSNI